MASSNPPNDCSNWSSFDPYKFQPASRLVPAPKFTSAKANVYSKAPLFPHDPTRMSVIYGRGNKSLPTVIYAKAFDVLQLSNKYYQAPAAGESKIFTINGQSVTIYGTSLYTPLCDQRLVANPARIEPFDPSKVFYKDKNIWPSVIYGNPGQEISIAGHRVIIPAAGSSKLITIGADGKLMENPPASSSTSNQSEGKTSPSNVETNISTNGSAASTSSSKTGSTVQTGIESSSGHAESSLASNSGTTGSKASSNSNSAPGATTTGVQASTTGKSDVMAGTTGSATSKSGTTITASASGITGSRGTTTSSTGTGTKGSNSTGTAGSTGTSTTGSTGTGTTGSTGTGTTGSTVTGTTGSTGTGTTGSTGTGTTGSTGTGTTGSTGTGTTGSTGTGTTGSTGTGTTGSTGTGTTGSTGTGTTGSTGTGGGGGGGGGVGGGGGGNTGSYDDGFTSSNFMQIDKNTNLPVSGSNNIANDTYSVVRAAQSGSTATASCGLGPPYVPPNSCPIATVRVSTTFNPQNNQYGLQIQLVAPGPTQYSAEIDGPNSGWISKQTVRVYLNTAYGKKYCDVWLYSLYSINGKTGIGPLSFNNNPQIPIPSNAPPPQQQQGQWVNGQFIPVGGSMTFPTATSNQSVAGFRSDTGLSSSPDGYMQKLVTGDWKGAAQK